MVILTGSDLTIKQVFDVAYKNDKVEISDHAKEQVQKCRQVIDEKTAKGEVIYGLTTGFGSLSRVTIDSSQAGQLSRNIARSHAISVGNSMPREHVRAAMVVRINALVKGNSGVTLEAVELMVNMLNFNVIPVVPTYGSLACSGDLCLLSTILVAMTKGSATDPNDKDDVKVDFNGKIMMAQQAFESTGLEKIVLSSKEGLAITNGSTFTVALMALCAYRIRRLFHNHVGAYAMMMEALKGCTDALDERIHKARNDEGQVTFSQKAREMISGSEYVNSTQRLQDCYSLRCAPQMHTMLFGQEMFESEITNELNAATDNPLIFGEDVVSGGNFAGYKLAMLCDFLKIIVTNQAKMSERRQFKILDSNANGGLPDMLTLGAGLNSGFMITQYTTASLLQRLQKHSFPDSVLNVPTCANQEDVNSNGHNAALNLWEMLYHCEQIVAFEYLLATRGIWLLKQTPEYADKKLGNHTTLMYKQLVEKIEQTHDDHVITHEFERVNALITSEEWEM
jgi:histidine ammonia-lyase